MIYLKLFLTFFEIGLVSFGGGYGMISLIREQVLSNGWLSENDLLNMIAVSESTPGPIAVNLATFIGAKQGGILGSLCATLGVILPSFVIILIIAALAHGFLKYRGVQAFLNGVRPGIVGIIIATAIVLFLSLIFGLKDYHSEMSFDPIACGIFAFLILVSFVYKRIRRKSISPIFMILISAVCGMIVYSIREGAVG